MSSWSYKGFIISGLFVLDQRARADHAGVEQQKESEVEAGQLMADHVHMMLSIPPKYSVSGVNERPSVKTFLMAFGSNYASYRFSYDK